MEKEKIATRSSLSEWALPALLQHAPYRAYDNATGARTESNGHHFMGKFTSVRHEEVLSMEQLFLPSKSIVITS